MYNTPTVINSIETSNKMSEQIYSEKYDCCIHPPGIAQTKLLQNQKLPKKIKNTKKTKKHLKIPKKIKKLDKKTKKIT